MKLAFSCFEPSGDVRKNLWPVIMLHGMLDSRKSWTRLAPKIANCTGRKVYTLDARNHGESPWTEDFDFELMARDVEEFMDERRISKAILIGHSMGGKTAMKFSTEKSERVEKLIIEDMISKPISLNGWKVIVIGVRILRESLSAIPKGADENTAKRAIGRFLLENLPFMMPKYDHEFGMQIMPFKKQGERYQWETNLDVLEKTLTTNEQFDKPLTSNYANDTLFLYGTKSFLKVVNDTSIQKLFPRFRMIPIERATHIVHFDKPDEFLREVVNFINDGRFPQMPQSKY